MHRCKLSTFMTNIILRIHTKYSFYLEYILLSKDSYDIIELFLNGTFLLSWLLENIVNNSCFRTDTFG